MNKQDPPRTAGLALIASATLLWSTSGFFAKAPLLEYWPPEQRGAQLAFWRVLFACCLLFPLVRKPQWTWRLIPAAGCFALMNYCYLMAMTTTTAANAIWLQYTAPAWVLIVGVWLLKEPFQGVDLVTVLFTLLGLAVIVGCELRYLDTDRFDRQGVFWGLAAGMFYAGVILCIRALRDLNSAWIVAVCHLAAALFMLPWIVAQHDWPPNAVLGWVAAFGFLQLGLPYLLFARGTRVITGHEASFIGLLEPVLVPAWAYLFWRHTPHYEAPAIWTFAGGGFILAGLLIRFLKTSLR